MASPFTDISDLIQTRWKTQVETGGDGGAPVTTLYANSGRNEPDSGLWARLTVREGTRDQSDFGATLVSSRTVGVAFAELFTDANDGKASLLALAERARVAFNRYSTGSLQFRTASFDGGGSSGERFGKWWRVTVRCPFWFDDVE